MRLRWRIATISSKIYATISNSSWIAGALVYQRLRISHSTEGSTNSQGLRGSLAVQTGTVESHAEAPGSQAERTSQPQEQVGPDAPKTTMEQDTELSCLTYAERKKKISRDKRYARYEHMLALHQAGMGQRAIAREMHMSRRIVHRYLSAEAFPERAPGSGVRLRGKSKLAPYLAYLRERWRAGEHVGSHLFCEIKERGYTGSESLTAAVAW